LPGKSDEGRRRLARLWFAYDPAIHDAIHRIQT
jgi:hypothetical protein